MCGGWYTQRMQAASYWNVSLLKMFLTGILLECFVVENVFDKRMCVNLNRVFFLFYRVYSHNVSYLMRFTFNIILAIYFVPDCIPTWQTMK